MNGNNPYAGLPGVSNAGERSPADIPNLSGEQKRSLCRDVSRIAARTREYLPNDFIVDSTVSIGIHGPEIQFAVHPPIGHPITTGFTPEIDEIGEEIIDSTERNELARKLAASAAFHVKSALGEGLTPTAR